MENPVLTLKSVKTRKNIYVKIILLLFISGLLIISCKKSAEVIAKEPPVAFIDTVETMPPIQKNITVNIDPKIGGYQEALPVKYSLTRRNYPLLIYLHGAGSWGNGDSDLEKLNLAAIPKMIKEKTFPPSFTVNNKIYSFIIISPQFKSLPLPKSLNEMVNYAILHYRVDQSQIYVTGVSMGGGVTWDYAAEYGNRVAAIVPICGSTTPTVEKAQKIAGFNIPVWAFHNSDDGSVPVSISIDFVRMINSYNPSPLAKLTIWPTGGHNAWTKATNPNYRENGMNMYEWMLHYSR